MNGASRAAGRRLDDAPPIGVDRECFTLDSVFDEDISSCLDANLPACGTCDADDPIFEESNPMHGPASTRALDMRPDVAGKRMDHRHVNGHIDAGMMATYPVVVNGPLAALRPPPGAPGRGSRGGSPASRRELRGSQA